MLFSLLKKEVFCWPVENILRFWERPAWKERFSFAPVGRFIVLGLITQGAASGRVFKIVVR